MAETDKGAAATEAAVQRAEDAKVVLDDPNLAKGEVVDPRLDNRGGTARPPALSFPGAPQQIDGPDLLHQREFTQRYFDNLEKAAKKGDATTRGMFSPGPHGLSPVEDRQGNDRADESGGKSAGDGESGSPDVGKVDVAGGPATTA